MKPHLFHFRIAYADTDAGGIAYHARYVEIAERARLDMLADAPGANGTLIVRGLSIKYIKPLRLADRFAVETRMVGAGAATVDLEQKFIKDGADHAVMRITLAHIDGDMKPAKTPPGLLAFFAA
ncbi:MAG: acyl-CoA thioesterase [Rickettsiales bacterium]|jgi:acyl-CoA thioester hydrolase|nr:acyl-CoA thioesterase [Rickettsiales bacterium]